jgi:hypothetical protein
MDLKLKDCGVRLENFHPVTCIKQLLRKPKLSMNEVVVPQKKEKEGRGGGKKMKKNLHKTELILRVETDLVHENKRLNF